MSIDYLVHVLRLVPILPSLIPKPSTIVRYPCWILWAGVDVVVEGYACIDPGVDLGESGAIITGKVEVPAGNCPVTQSIGQHEYNLQDNSYRTDT